MSFVRICYNSLTAAPESDSFMVYVVLDGKRFNKNKG